MYYREYICGGGLVSPCREIFYLKIPKNASTYLNNILLTNGWEEWNLVDHPIPIKKSIVFIRDPVDRWCSAFATYAALHLFGYGYGSDHFIADYNDLSKKIIFDQIIFDDHTDLQVKYITQVLDYNPFFFRYNKFIIAQINSFLNCNLNTNVDVEDNDSKNNYDTKTISKFIRKQLDENPDLKSKVVNCYRQDYEFINRINFYNEPR